MDLTATLVLYQFFPTSYFNSQKQKPRRLKDIQNPQKMEALRESTMSLTFCIYQDQMMQNRMGFFPTRNIPN